jgi:hypothetical protein
VQVPFYDNASAFTRRGACTQDDAVVDFRCPYTSDAHTCNLAAYGAHHAYAVEFVCPFVVPTCLRYDARGAAFAEHVCALGEGYTPTQVTTVSGAKPRVRVSKPGRATQGKGGGGGAFICVLAYIQRPQRVNLRLQKPPANEHTASPPRHHTTTKTPNNR